MRTVQLFAHKPWTTGGFRGDNRRRRVVCGTMNPFEGVRSAAAQQIFDVVQEDLFLKLSTLTRLARDDAVAEAALLSLTGEKRYLKRRETVVLYLLIYCLSSQQGDLLTSTSIAELNSYRRLFYRTFFQHLSCVINWQMLTFFLSLFCIQQNYRCPGPTPRCLLNSFNA